MADLIKEMGAERNWTSAQIEEDLTIAKDHRLTTVTDLMALSEKSWDAIPLKPLVKDLLKLRLNQWTANASACTLPTRIVASNTSSTSLIAPSSSGSRLRVTANGIAYEVDRFCPHKGADLSTVRILSFYIRLPCFQV